MHLVSGHCWLRTSKVQLRTRYKMHLRAHTHMDYCTSSSFHSFQ
jgi:hypothetical protein